VLIVPSLMAGSRFETRQNRSAASCARPSPRGTGLRRGLVVFRQPARPVGDVVPAGGLGLQLLGTTRCPGAGLESGAGTAAAAVLLAVNVTAAAGDAVEASACSSSR
jgi:hypothetical protein